MYGFGRILIILTMILFWWGRVDSGKPNRLVDCEKYVYHPHCRGTQAKKRIVNTLASRKADRVCTCKSISGNNYGGLKRNLLADSKLLTAIFARGIDVNTIYDAYTTYSSSSTEKNGNDDTRGVSIINSSGRKSKNSISDDEGNHHRSDEDASKNRILLPLSRKTIDFMEPLMDMDYSS